MGSVDELFPFVPLGGILVFGVLIMSMFVWMFMCFRFASVSAGKGIHGRNGSNGSLVVEIMELELERAASSASSRCFRSTIMARKAAVC